ncbi:cupredoxin domain-containing protein [Candidatus Kaiserbacteria bacterium]|nr:cupredoxin domain-containing protein [Candidatus Kaiserbacteria bacterium]
MKYFIILLAVVIVGVLWFHLTDKAEQLDPTPQETATMEENSEQDLEEIEPDVTFKVTGVNYSYNVKEMRVKKGDVVRIDFTSNLGFHDWVVDEFSAKTKTLRPGTSDSITFVADKVGTFEYYCSVGSHREQGMVGSLIVEE